MPFQKNIGFGGYVFDRVTSFPIPHFINIALMYYRFEIICVLGSKVL